MFIKAVKALSISAVLVFSSVSAHAQVSRPKLVVGLVVDQMRWDYLYRYSSLYGNDGFKRLLGNGYSCANTFINYLPSYTAVGHTTIFTGSVPSLHGIAGNDWRNQETGKTTYCTDDATVQTVGASGDAGQMSPRNLMVTTITDELRLATNFASKVVGVSLKDRASILPAGHNPTGAYWLDDASANFITSTYYANSLPAWVNAFNSQKNIDKLIANGWQPLLNASAYDQSSKDDSSWEGRFKGNSTAAFPYNLKSIYAAGKSSFRNTPFGNTLTLNFAKAAIEGEKLGQGKETDFLTINCASTDYVGHMFGINAMETEDTYLRLDRDLAVFLKYLDDKIGKGNYLLFLTADHGAAHAEGYMESVKMPTGFAKKQIKPLNAALEAKFGIANLVLGIDNDAVSFNNAVIESKGLDIAKLKIAAINYLEKQPEVLYVVDEDMAAVAPVPQPIREMIVNGYNRRRTGAVKIIYQSNYLSESYKTGTTHGAWNPYDTHIPLVFFGWKVPHGENNAMVNMTDISATLAALLHIQMPSGCIGKPITELTEKINR